MNVIIAEYEIDDRRSAGLFVAETMLLLSSDMRVDLAGRARIVRTLSRHVINSLEDRLHLVRMAATAGQQARLTPVQRACPLRGDRDPHRHLVTDSTLQMIDVHVPRCADCGAAYVNGASGRFVHP